MSETVSVVCKVPNGLDLRVFDWEEKTEAIMGGGYRVFKIAKLKGAPVHVNGPAIPYGKIPRTPIIGGYRVTHGIDKDFFDEWMRQNAEHEIVINHLIYAGDMDEVESFAKEHRKDKSGLQPLDVSIITMKGQKKLADPRIEEATNMNVSPIVEGARDAQRDLQDYE